MLVLFDHDADPEGCEGPCHESVLQVGGFYTFSFTPYLRTLGPIPPHGFSNRNRVRHSAVGLKESITPCRGPAQFAGVFVYCSATRS